ncbi:hypothetical protein EMPS_09725 [Entomortierella parvispora]|uniref:Hepatocellular carcinoma-associated antigen 59-domain-containing protein n=1 Tax=Entomortierella parvispora TaxID=205924 RepID=A0A9P3M0B1_9FUNG|nr:hypothetical protein EMPS_09725 [Entomortierella parvispora]
MSSVTFKAGTAKRRNYRKRETTPDEDSPSSNTEAGDESLAQSNEEEGLSLEELVELRKLRQRPTGIAATDLLVGDTTGKKKKKDKAAAPEDPWKMSSGGGLVDLDKVREGDASKSAGILNSFTKQTNTLDVDKHMMKYIEDELKKRRGETGDAEADFRDQAQEHHADTDILDELGIRRTAPKPEQEGNVQLSTTMLTAIPEVDLGMEARLKNIEDTEKAKRKLLEERSTTRINTERFSAPAYVPSDRERVSHHQQNNRRNNNSNSNNQNNNLNSGMDAGIANHRFHNVNSDQNRRGGAGRGMATDDMVMERFKKRMRR